MEIRKISGNRDEIQSKATNSIIENNYTGVYEISPRVGKTKIVLDAIKDKINRTIYILVPGKTVLNSWKKDMVKFKFPKEVNVVLLCFKSLHKIPNNAQLIVVDECHMLSYNNHFSLRNLTPKRLLLLSGTIGKYSLHLIKSILNLKINFTYSIEDAIEDDIVAGFEISVLRVELDDEERNLPLNNGPMATEKEIYDFMTRRISELEDLIEKKKSLKKRVFYDIKLKERLTRERANFIYYSLSKINVVEDFLEKTKDIRKVVFCSRNEIADLITGFSYHQANEKENNLEKFINDENLKVLGVVNKISVGVTIPNLKFIVFQHLYSNSEMSIQKIMRACNFENGKIGKIVIFCLKDTRDEEWVKSALSDINPDRVKYYDYSEKLDLKLLLP